MKTQALQSRVPPSSVSQKLSATLDLFSAGLALTRGRLRRAHPLASDEEIEAMVHEWLADDARLMDGQSDLIRVAWPRSHGQADE